MVQETLPGNRELEMAGLWIWDKDPGRIRAESEDHRHFGPIEVPLKLRHFVVFEVTICEIPAVLT
jgi:hypothetical protein